jgi:hypothetical protein
MHVYWDDLAEADGKARRAEWYGMPKAVTMAL